MKLKKRISNSFDFSWVHDLERKFHRERDQIDRSFDSVHQRSLHRGLRAPTRPIPEPDYVANNYVGQSNPEQPPMQTIYFGASDQASMNDLTKVPPPSGDYKVGPALGLPNGGGSDARRAELDRLTSNVRSKTAIFESEARKNNVIVHPPEPYIPQPDYYQTRNLQEDRYIWPNFRPQNYSNF